MIFVQKQVENYEICSTKMTKNSLKLRKEREKAIIRQNNTIEDLESTVQLNKNIIVDLKHSIETANTKNETITKEL